MVLRPAFSFTRREVLVGLLGATWAGCRRPPPTPSIEGEIVETASKTLAHRVRERAPMAPTRTEEVPVLILGGGIAGLTAGWWLRRQGFDGFALLELGPQPGGTSASGSRDGLEFPWGAHYLPTPGDSQPELIEFLEQFGTVVRREKSGPLEYSETELCAAPKERVFFRGIWFEGLYPRRGASPAELEQLARFQREIDTLIETRDPEGRRAFTLPIAQCADTPDLRALDQLSMSEWLDRHGFDSPRLRWLVDYACRDDFGLRPLDTSAWAGLHYFAARTERAGEDSAEFLTWPAGNGELVHRLSQAVGSERIRCQHLVLGVSPEGDGRRARVLVLNAQSNELFAIVAERVIYALPSFTRRHLLSGFENAVDYHPAYAPWLVANVHLADRPRSVGFPTAWDNVIYGSNSLGYVVSTHQLHRERGPTVWTYYLPLSDARATSGRAQLESLTWDDAANAVSAELSACHPDFRTHARRVDVLKWGHGMVRPEVGTLFGSTRLAAARPLGPVHFAHSDLSGIALFEEAFFHGVRAAREVIGGVRL